MGIAGLRALLNVPGHIGRVPRSERGPRLLATGIAALALTVDVWLIKSEQHNTYAQRAVPALVAVVLMWLACRRDRPSLGLTLKTEQGARWWWKGTLLVALVMGVILFALLGILALAGKLQPVFLHPSRLAAEFIHGCVWAPLVEEALYRLVLVVPLAALLRPGWVIVVAGLIFGGLHVLYGNPAPDNLIGGFFMTWAYLKSGSIALPLLYHVAGNAFVIGTQLMAYELF